MIVLQISELSINFNEYSLVASRINIAYRVYAIVRVRIVPKPLVATSAILSTVHSTVNSFNKKHAS
jgi:hypothetical protein